MPACLVAVVHRARRRRRSQRIQLVVDLVPDSPLVSTNRSAACDGGEHGLVLQTPQRWIRGLRRRCEVLRVPRSVPAAGLDTAHWYLQGAMCGHEDREVERPVLLGAQHFFALEEQNGQAGRVANRADRTAGTRRADQRPRARRSQSARPSMR